MGWGNVLLPPVLLSCHAGTNILNVNGEPSPVQVRLFLYLESYPLNSALAGMCSFVACPANNSLPQLNIFLSSSYHMLILYSIMVFINEYNQAHNEYHEMAWGKK